ncbi:MAG: glycosyltransferase [Actinomycetota bacterium]|nr:glycosyltransferase [Actinomycetota bacterium]
MRFEPRIVLDCRWLANGGAGRVTELLLRGLADSPPSRGRWVVWGPPRAAALAWPGAEVVSTSVDPRALAGQRAWLAVPKSDLAVFLHQLRPLRAVRSLTFVYDTIPLRFSGRGLARTAKRLFLQRVTATSRQLITASEYAKTCIQRDLGVGSARVAVVDLPFDDAFVARVVDLRCRQPTAEVALFVGRFAAHKNLPRLIAAFGRTEFCRGGGRLLLVGGREDELRALGHQMTPSERNFVECRPGCPQDELERLFATSRMAVQPSLEEGFGLPAWEALSCGLPVCISDGGALPEVTRGLVDTFPASSVAAMATAIDECAERARADPDHAMDVSGRLRARAPTIGQFAGQVAELAMRNLPTPTRAG